MFTIICRHYLQNSASIISVLTRRHVHMVGPYSTSLYWSVIRANVLDSEHNQTHATAHLRSSIYFSSLRRLQLMSIAVLDVFCLVVCVNLWPKTVVSHGEQNRYGWRRLTLLTARLIKFYGGLRLMKSTAAYGGG